MATDAELLADLLDGRLDPADAPAELAELADLAGVVSEHITLVPPTPAFRASLREEVLQAVAGPGAGPPTGGGASGGAPGSTAGGGLGSGGASAGGAAGATYAATGVPAIVAAVAATVVLATGTQALTARSAPGDLLYGLKQGVESLQLTFADDQRDVALLVGFATERVREAVGLADTAVVIDLLGESERLLDDALALAVEQGRDVQDLLDGYASALVTLDSRTDDEAVRAVVGELLGDVGVVPSDPVPDPVVPGDDSDEDPDDGTPDDAGDVTDDGVTDGPGGEPQDEPTDGPLDELDDPLEDPLDELDDPLEDPLDELDDPTELDEPLDELEDEVDDTLDDGTDTLDDGTDTLDDATDTLGG